MNVMYLYRASIEYYFNPVMFVLPPHNHLSPYSYHNSSEWKKNHLLKLKPLETWLPEEKRNSIIIYSLHNLRPCTWKEGKTIYRCWVKIKYTCIPRLNKIPCCNKDPRSSETPLREIPVYILSGASEHTSISVLMIWVFAHPKLIKVSPEGSNEIFCSIFGNVVRERFW